MTLHDFPRLCATFDKFLTPHFRFAHGLRDLPTQKWPQSDFLTPDVTQTSLLGSLLIHTGGKHWKTLFSQFWVSVRFSGVPGELGGCQDHNIRRGFHGLPLRGWQCSRDELTLSPHRCRQLKHYRVIAFYSPVRNYCEITSENILPCNWNAISQDNNAQIMLPFNSLNHKRIRVM